MSHGDLDEFLDYVDDIKASRDAVLIAKAAHLLDRLLDEYAQWQLRELRKHAGDANTGK